jgi:glycosyltransferase involved in cell wall biosynthesis
MKIAFVDPYGWDYDPQTPFRRPLGGTQSALAYLSAALVRREHDVTLVNGVREPRVCDGVRCTRLADLNGRFLDTFDLVVVASVAVGQRLRKSGAKVPLVLWCQHADDQPAVAALHDPHERAAWRGYAMVSHWQADRYVRVLGVDAAAVRILRNAIAPAFEAAVPHEPWFRCGRAPALAYTSTPFRGLDVLLDAFPVIRAHFPGARLAVWSGMSVYNKAAADDPYAALYERCRALTGVEYHGPIAQSALAPAMAGIDVLAYPCTFAETSCIAAMEAMAAGAFVVTTQLGALPETTAGYGHLLDLDGNAVVRADEYAHFAVQALRAAAAAPAATLARRDAQRRHALLHCTWSQRADEWTLWLSGLAA